MWRSMTCPWLPEGDLQEFALPLLHVGSADGVQAVRLGGKHLYLWSHLTKLSYLFFFINLSSTYPLWLFLFVKKL